MIWELGDDDSAVLLRAAHKALLGARTPIALPEVPAPAPRSASLTGSSSAAPAAAQRD